MWSPPAAPRIIADVRNDPDYLNRAGRLLATQTVGDGPLSFLCVPIKIEGRTAGALSVDKPFVDDDQLQSDRSVLDIVAAFLAQAIQINRMVMRQKEELLKKNAQLRSQVRDRYRFENIIGDSPSMHEVFATVGQVANSRATVLLLGETGTGKEMIAKAIHYNSPRKEKPFVRVNCGALTGTLLESELFGHVKGLIHRRDQGQDGSIRSGRRRHDLSRRDRHARTAIAGETAARAAGARIRTGRRHADGESRRARDRRHERRSSGSGRARKIFEKICFTA